MKNWTKIITHRGLDPDRKPYFAESSKEAFLDQLNRGYGLEFDVRWTKDGVMIAIHDLSLKRPTEGKDARNISDIDSKELLAMEFGSGEQLSHLMTIPELLAEIREKQAPGAISALHLKSAMQTPDKIDELLRVLHTLNAEKFMIFDTKIEIAKYIASKDPRIQLAASVAHHYDIKRYNGVVGETLISLEDITASAALFDWAWLDEWDLADEGGGTKTLYNQKTFEIFRSFGIQIALVTPELHGTSPGLLGGEAHQDAKDRATLDLRLQAIVNLGPDAVCTDHPDYVKSLLS